MRVLLVADDCTPDWLSAPLFTYRAARAIARHADVVLVTHIRHAPTIQKAGMGALRSRSC